MPTNTQEEWNKYIDDSTYDEKDAEEFRSLLGDPSDSSKGNTTVATPGTILKGTVVEIGKDHIVVDVGLKSEGIVPIEEFANPRELELNSEIEVFLDEAEDENGQIVLSREKAERLRQWEFIVSNCEEGSIVKGKVLRKVKGGLMVDIGMEAFLPGSQIDNKRIKNLDEYLGQTYEFKILKINIERKNVVVSRREILEAERISKKITLLETIKVGDMREGIAKNITDFGVFLDLDGIDGLLHITDMSWKKIRHPSEMVQLGDKLEVMILNVDKDNARVALGLKQKESNPWEGIEEKYPPGTRIKGKIVNLVTYGAFIEIERGIEGLIHVSEMSWTKKIKNPSEIVNIGDEIEAEVLSIQKDLGKISLGIKQIEHNPWDDIDQRYPLGEVFDVVVKSLTNFGAFVELEEGIEGLIHISDLSWTKKYSHPSEMLNPGDKSEVLKIGNQIKAVILSVDKGSKKITLGIKQLTPDPWETLKKTLAGGTKVAGKVTRHTAYGVVLELDNEIEGLIHVADIPKAMLIDKKMEEQFAIDSEITAIVKKVDSENKKVALSIKEGESEEDQENQDDIVIAAPKEEKVRDAAVEESTP